MRTSGTSSPLFASVLCPVDFSDHARLALQYAAVAARRAGGGLHPLFVNDPLLVAAAAAAYNRSSLGAASRVELKRFVTSALPARSLAGLRVRYHVALGKPAREILATAQRDGHDLIVLGTKGLNGAKRLLLGSTTTEVLRRARVPVLAVPQSVPAPDRPKQPKAGWPGRTIVAAIEFGPRAPEDVLRAAEVARLFRAHLLLAHVVPIPVMPPWLSADVDGQVRRGCAQAEAALAALRGELSGLRVTTVVRVGHPPEQIAAIAADHNAGLIVMGLRGRTGLFGESAGTCAYQVLCHGVAPVLALPDTRRTSRRP